MRTHPNDKPLSQWTEADYEFAYQENVRKREAYQKAITDQGVLSPPSNLEGMGSYAQDDPETHEKQKES